MSPELESALAECDELGVALWLANGKLSFRAGDAGFPDLLRQKLRGLSDELTALLAADARPQPELVPFVARNLGVWWFEFELVKATPVLLVSGRPYYRVTPSVWARFAKAIETRSEANLSDPVAIAEVRAAIGQLLALGDWVEAHYRPDQIARALANPFPLPPVPRGPLAFLNDLKEPPCPVSPKSSACAPSPFVPTKGRRRTGGATVATGNESERLF